MIGIYSSKKAYIYTEDFSFVSHTGWLSKVLLFWTRFFFLDHTCSAILFSSSSHTALSPLDLTACQSSVFNKSDGLLFQAKYAVMNSRSEGNTLLCRFFRERDTFTLEPFMIETNSKLH